MSPRDLSLLALAVGLVLCLDPIGRAFGLIRAIGAWYRRRHG